MFPEHWSMWPKCLVVVALCLLSYGDQLDGQFVFDDEVAATNKLVNSGSWKDAFTHDFWGTPLLSPLSHKSYRPFTTLTFRAEYQIWGLADCPFWMKLTNLGLHVLISSFMLDFGDIFARDNCRTSFLAAVLFAVHPIHTEAVSGIVGRADLLATLSFILAVRVYFRTFIGDTSINTIKTWAVLRVVFLSLAGVLFKETAVAIFLVCAALDVLYNTNLLRGRSTWSDWKEFPILRITSMVISCALVTGGRFFMGLPKFQVEDNPFAMIENDLFRIINRVFLHSINGWLLICPDWLSFDWSMGCLTPINSWTDYRLLAVALHLLVLSSVGLACIFNRRRVQTAALILIVLPFIPASGIIHVGFVIAERILYMPSLGWCLLVAIGFRKVLRFSKRSRRREFTIALKVLFILTVFAFVQKSRLRASEWKVDQVLYNSALRVCPNNAKVFYNIANIASKKRDPETAISSYRQAILLYPNYDAALMNLGNVYRDRGDLDNAEYYLRRALGSINIIDKRAAAEMNLGIVMVMRKKYSEAMQHYNRALIDRPYYPVCYYNLGNAYLELQKFDLAQKNFETALNLDRTMELAWKNLLTLLYNEGKYEDVITRADQGISHNPNKEVEFLFPKANALAKLKRNEEAEQVFLYLIEQRPREGIYLGNLGVLYHHWQKYDRAAIYYEKALEVNPGLERLRNALDKVKQKKRQQAM